MILRIVAYGTVFLSVWNRGTRNVSVDYSEGESVARTYERAEDDYFADIMLTACCVRASKTFIFMVPCLADLY